MSERKTLEQLTNGELHISHSQISCYQNCSLKYFYRYVEGRKAESISVSLAVVLTLICSSFCSFLSLLQENNKKIISNPGIKCFFM